MRTILILLFLAAAGLSQTLAIRNVTVVDAGGLRPGSNVVIRSGRILAAGPGARIPAGARIVDGRGKYLIPGLWDMHVHLHPSEPMTGLYLAAGVTGVRDMGSDAQRTDEIRTQIRSGKRPGPVIYTSGSAIAGPQTENTHGPAIRVSTGDDGRLAVNRIEASPADFIKVLSTVPGPAYFSLAQRARLFRIPFAGHIPEAVSLLDAINMRQKSVEHMFGIAIACTPLETLLREQRMEAIAKRDYEALRSIRKRTYETFSPGLANTVFRRMATYGVWQTPTLTLRKRLALLGIEDLAASADAQYVPESVRTTWPDPRKDLDRATAEQKSNFQEDWEFHRKLVTMMQNAGTGILAGTDTGDPWVVPGFALHDELALLVDAGLTPAQALATATLNPARYFNLETTHGSVASGKVASLVLLDADPLEDIRNTRRIAAVIQNGKLLDRKCLDTLLAGKPSPCAFTFSAPKPAPSSAKRPASSRKPGSRTR